ncbi:MAG: hypothetical protein FJ271_05560 [Planctomycetes bacterium]|nr:hypothetical protein [Planctomycetota bacterium]
MTSKPGHDLVRQAAYLAGGVLLLWGIAVVPARFAQGEAAIYESAAAAGLCLLPALATLIWSQRAGTSMEARLLSLVGGTGLRMMFVLGGGFGLTRLLPDWFDWTFWIWLMVFYIFTLGLETTLLVKSRGRPTP